jgi:hypothetical protein
MVSGTRPLRCVAPAPAPRRAMPLQLLSQRGRRGARHVPIPPPRACDGPPFVVCVAPCWQHAHPRGCVGVACMHRFPPPSLLSTARVCEIARHLFLERRSRQCGKPAEIAASGYMVRRGVGTQRHAALPGPAAGGPRLGYEVKGLKAFSWVQQPRRPCLCQAPPRPSPTWPAGLAAARTLRAASPAAAWRPGVHEGQRGRGSPGVRAATGPPEPGHRGPWPTKCPGRGGAVPGRHACRRHRRL